MKHIVTVLAILLLTVNANAQVQRKVKPTDSLHSGKTGTQADDKRGNATKSNMQVIKQLNLTREQKGKLKEMRQNNQAKRQTITNDANLSELEKKDKMKELAKSGVIELQGILTPEQLTKMKELRKQQTKGNKKMEEETYPEMNMLVEDK